MLYALILLYDKISFTIERSEYTVGIFLDLWRVFDMVNFNILFNKLDYYGFRGVVIDWIKNYLFARTQFVDLNDHYSTFCISCGVHKAPFLILFSFCHTLMNLLVPNNKP